MSRVIQRYSVTTWEQEARAMQRRQAVTWTVLLFLGLCFSAILADLLFSALAG